MKKFFDTNENIADKAFTQSIVISVVGILLCIVALCSATYAWFAADISSSKNTISAAFFDLDVQIVKTASQITTVAEGETNTQGEPSAEGQQLAALTADYGIYTLEAGCTYQVTLSVSDGATASKGYCDMVIYANGGETTYRSPNMTKNADGSSSAIVFQLTVKGTGTVQVVFQPKWGMPSGSEGIQPITAEMETVASAQPNTEGGEGAETTNSTQPATEPTESATEPTEPETNND